MEKETLQICIHSEDREELQALADLLRDDVRQMGGTLEHALAAPGEDEEGRKGPGGIDWNTLLVTLLASGGVVVTLINLIQARLVQPASITLKMDGDEITLAHAGKITDEDHALVEKFLKVHEGRMTPEERRLWEEFKKEHQQKTKERG